VTAGTDRLAPEFAILAGAIGAVISYFTNKGLKNAGVDDPVGAVGVHGAAGAWGVLILAVAPGYSDDTYDWAFHFKSQIIGVLLILVWAAVTGCVLFAALKYTIGLRNDDDSDICVKMGLQKNESADTAAKDNANNKGLEEVFNPQQEAPAPAAINVKSVEE